MKLRIGLGYDVHRLVEGRPCWLGGVLLPHPTGPSGHSDGDAVLHAVTDAMLGGAGLEDLGSLYPDTDPAFKDADSKALLADAMGRVRAKGFEPLSVDIVIATEGPRIAPHRAAMRASLAALLGMDADAVNVKGKTLEGLGAFAKGAAVEVQAVALLQGAS